MEAVKPWLREFWAERAFPSGDTGPVKRAALARLAARYFSETVWERRGTGFQSGPEGARQECSTLSHELLFEKPRVEFERFNSLRFEHCQVQICRAQDRARHYIRGR